MQDNIRLTPTLCRMQMLGENTKGLSKNQNAFPPGIQMPLPRDDVSSRKPLHSKLILISPSFPNSPSSAHALWSIFETVKLELAVPLTGIVA